MNRWMCVILSMLWSPVLLCSPSAADLAVYKQTGERLVSLIEAAQAERGVPQLKTTEVMDLIRGMSEESRILRRGSYPESEVGTLIEVCGLANKVSVSLVLFELNEHISAGASQAETRAKVFALMHRNTLTFQDELQVIQPFLLRCLAKQLSAVSQFAASLSAEEITDVRRQGLATMRSGLTQLYVGVVVTANDARYSDAFRLSLLTALAETSGVFASAIELPVRRQLHETARIAASQSDQPYKRLLSRIVRALSRESCEELCAFR